MIETSYLWLIVTDARVYAAVFLACCLILAGFGAAVGPRISFIPCLLYSNTATLILGAAAFCVQSLYKGVALSIPASLMALFLFFPTYVLALTIAVFWLIVTGWTRANQLPWAAVQFAATLTDLAVRLFGLTLIDVR